VSGGDGAAGTSPDPALTVRRLAAADTDLAVIVAQIAAARMQIGEPITLQSLNNFLVDTRNVYLVAHIGGELAGALHAMHYTHPSGHTYVYVDELDTDEAFRRRGVATRLMKAIRDIAREMGADEAWLGADDGNDAAHALYRKLDPDEIDPGVIYSYRV
jgi:aminoglycoside 3-N-acetyltransferase I